ncbi:hypothetical protein GF343_03175 [Candidatus Woesearchaeota archaeon]|nr:hypothetical protein [Candidatus Woesearchaeota archaeon]
MKRRLVSQGRATLTISLPSKWLKTFDLKPGDEVDIEEKGAELVVKTEKGVTIEKTQIDAQDYQEKLLEKVMVYLYRKGYDEIELILESPDQIEHVQRIIQLGLVGFEVVTHGQRNCIIKNISGPMESEFDPMLRRVFLLVKSMAFEGLAAIKTKNPGLLNSIILSEKTNNRLTSICRRIINKRGLEKNSTFLYSIVLYLEKIADEYRDLYKYIQEQKPKITPAELKLMEAVDNILNDMYENFYKYDKKKVVRIRQEYAKAKKELEMEFLNKKANAKITHHMSNILEMTTNCLYFTFAIKL